MQINNENKARVFFALWPEAAVRQALHALAKEFQTQCRARAMRADTLHMTLLFLGSVERKRLPQLMQAAARVSAAPFAFALERMSFWQHNRIAYAAPVEPVPALVQLAITLQQELVSTGFEFDKRDFNPHVTLLRNVGQVLETQTVKPIIWQADTFVLVESVMTDRGIRYQILQEWPLVSVAE